MKITVDISKFNINTTAMAAKMERAIKTGLNAASSALVTDIVASFGQGHGGKPSAPGSPPNRQKGALSRSIAYMVDGRTARVGSNLIYSRIHEKGGTIRPKNGRFLWIPINAKRSEKPSTMFGRKDISFLPRRSGGYFVVKRGKKGRKLKGGLLYVLVHGVHLEPRPYLKPALHRMAPKMGPIFATAAHSTFMGGVA